MASIDLDSLKLKLIRLDPVYWITFRHACYKLYHDRLLKIKGTHRSGIYDKDKRHSVRGELTLDHTRSVDDIVLTQQWKIINLLLP